MPKRPGFLGFIRFGTLIAELVTRPNRAQNYTKRDTTHAITANTKKQPASEKLLVKQAWTRIARQHRRNERHGHYVYAGFCRSHVERYGKRGTDPNPSGNAWPD